MAAANSRYRKRGYVFVFGEVEAVFAINEEPTREDLNHVRQGTALIIRLADLHFFGRTGEWRPMNAGCLGAAEIDDRRTGTFHAPAEHFDTP